MIVDALNSQIFPARRSDPIIAAIRRHRAAIADYRVAPEGGPSLLANDEYDAATDALVSTSCTTRHGARSLLAHIRWWLAKEAEFAAGHQPGYGLAQVRAADLTLLLEPDRDPDATAMAPRRAPERQHRFDQAGEILAALIIVIGGTIAVSIATLV